MGFYAKRAAWPGAPGMAAAGPVFRLCRCLSLERFDEIQEGILLGIYGSINSHELKVPRFSFFRNDGRNHSLGRASHIDERGFAGWQLKRLGQFLDVLLGRRWQA